MSLTRYRIGCQFHVGGLVALNQKAGLLGMVHRVGKNYVEVLLHCTGVDDVGMFATANYPKTSLRRYVP